MREKRLGRSAHGGRVEGRRYSTNVVLCDFGTFFIPVYTQVSEETYTTEKSGEGLTEGHVPIALP